MVYHLSLEDSKYNITVDLENNIFNCSRHGEPWRDLIGDKLVLSMVNMIESLSNERDRLLANIRDYDSKTEKLDEMLGRLEVLQTRLETPDINDLVGAVLSWWEEHQFDVDVGQDDEYNRYDEEPGFVKIALKIKKGS